MTFMAPLLALMRSGLYLRFGTVKWQVLCRNGSICIFDLSWIHGEKFKSGVLNYQFKTSMKFLFVFNFPEPNPLIAHSCRSCTSFPLIFLPFSTINLSPIKLAVMRNNALIDESIKSRLNYRHLSGRSAFLPPLHQIS